MTVKPVLLLAVQVVREIDKRGGTASLHQLAHGSSARRDVKRALMAAARDRLVRSFDGETFTLTAKARQILSQADAPAAEAA